MKEDLDVLSNYYLPCKRKIYFTNVILKIITIETNIKITIIKLIQ